MTPELARKALQMLRERPLAVSTYLGYKLPPSFFQEERTPEQVKATEDLMAAVASLDEKVQRLIVLLDKAMTQKPAPGAPRQQPISRSGLPT